MKIETDPQKVLDEVIADCAYCGRGLRLRDPSTTTREGQTCAPCEKLRSEILESLAANLENNGDRLRECVRYLTDPETYEGMKFTINLNLERDLAEFCAALKREPHRGARPRPALVTIGFGPEKGLSIR
jgi:hypothetical protein